MNGSKVKYDCSSVDGPGLLTKFLHTSFPYPWTYKLVRTSNIFGLILIAINVLWSAGDENLSSLWASI
jgi:hypothetical protein